MPRETDGGGESGAEVEPMACVCENSDGHVCKFSLGCKAQNISLGVYSLTSFVLCAAGFKHLLYVQQNRWIYFHFEAIRPRELGL